jgi:hypothetical protein
MTATTRKRKARTPKGIKIRMWRKRTTVLGKVYACYEAKDGQTIEVLIRDGWGQSYLLTPSEAHETALWRLTAKPGSVRRLDSSPAGWHVYERTDGTQHAVPTRGRRGSTLTEAQTKELAAKALEGK